MRLHEAHAVQHVVLNRVIEDWAPTSLGWNWASGLVSHALLLIHESYGDKRIEPYLQTWMDHHVAGNTPIHDPGGILWKIGPGLCALHFARKTNAPGYTQRVQAIQAHLAKTPRLKTSKGRGLFTSKEKRNEVWVDSLMTLCPFLARADTLGYGPEGQSLAEQQILGHAQCLVDPQTGLWFHAYDTGKRKPLGARWSRGMGWALFSLVEVLGEQSPTAREHSALALLLRDTVHAVLRAQDRAGHWYTVMDRNNSFVETSGQALLVYGLAKALRLGLIPQDLRKQTEEAIVRGWRIVTLHVTDQGHVTGVTAGTNAGTYRHYMTRKTRGWTPWGEASALLAAHEACLLQKTYTS